MKFELRSKREEHSHLGHIWISSDGYPIYGTYEFQEPEESGDGYKLLARPSGGLEFRNILTSKHVRPQFKAKIWEYASEVYGHTFHLQQG